MSYRRRCQESVVPEDDEDEEHDAPENMSVQKRDKN